MRRDVLTGEYFTEGDIACAEGAIAAGCRFFAGYPITPSSELAEHMAARLPEVDGVFIQMEDELGSMAAVIGASWAGVKSMTATSGPGFSLMQENIGLAIMTETPCVIVNIMRGGPSTGQPTKSGQQDVMQAKWGSHGDYEIIAVCPSTVQEMFDLTIEAFNLSEIYRVPVIVLGDEILGHLTEKLVIPQPEEIEIVERRKPPIKEGYSWFKFNPASIPAMASFGEGFKVYATGLTHDETGHPDMSPETQTKLVKYLCDKVRKNADRIVKYKEIMLDDAEIAIITYGSPVRSALSAVKRARKEGIKVGLLKLSIVWPFPEKIVKKVSEEVDTVVVLEMNYGQILREVQRVAGLERVKFLPKFGEDLHKPGEVLELVRRCKK